VRSVVTARARNVALLGVACASVAACAIIVGENKHFYQADGDAGGASSFATSSASGGASATSTSTSSAGGSGGGTPLTAVMAVTAGGAHTCALKTGGGVLCWGDNAGGDLGNGSATPSLVPVSVAGLSSGATAIAAGRFHSCALTMAGGARCWGQNVNGQLGNNSENDSAKPVDVLLSSSVTAIAAGGAHTCALTTAGAVQCWGLNANGQLGDNSMTVKMVPVASGLSSGVVALAAGHRHTCALTTGGGVQCWGFNSNGQLGDGSMADRSLPVAVLGLSSGVAAIALGQYHSCALTTEGDVKCWGYNLKGQLGNGVKPSSGACPTAIWPGPSDRGALA